MHPLEIAALVCAAYIGAGAVLSTRDARAVIRADPGQLCSDACRRWHERAMPYAQGMASLPAAPVWHVVTGLVWPRVLTRRCGCFRRAGHTH